MKKLFYLFVILLFAMFPVMAQEKEDPYPLWTEIVTSQPQGYVVLENGDVEISSAEGLVWLISERLRAR